MTRPAERDSTRARRVVDALRAAGLTIAAIRIGADGSVEIMTPDDPRLVAEKAAPRHDWSA
jgi:hypothetical protein